MLLLLLMMVGSSVVIISMLLRIIISMMTRVVLSGGGMHPSMNMSVPSRSSHVVSSSVDRWIIWMVYLLLSLHFIVLLVFVLSWIYRIHSVVFISLSFVVLLFLRRECLKKYRKRKAAVRSVR